MKDSIHGINRCDLTDLFEIAVMHQQPLHLTWLEGQERHSGRIAPCDLVTEQGQEFLIGTDDDGAPWRMPLEQICAVKEFQP